MNIVVIDWNWIEGKQCLSNLDWKIVCDENLVCNFVLLSLQYFKVYVIYVIQKDGHSVLQIIEKSLLKKTFLGSLLLLTL